MSCDKGGRYLAWLFWRGAVMRKGSRKEEVLLLCLCTFLMLFPPPGMCFPRSSCNWLLVLRVPLKDLLSSPREGSPDLTHNWIIFFMAHCSNGWFLVVCFDGFYFSVYCSSSSLGCELLDCVFGTQLLAQSLTHSRCSMNRKYTRSVDPRPRSKHMELVWRKGRWGFCTVIERWMKISDTLNIWQHIHKAGRLLENTIHEYLHKLKMEKDFLGPNSHGHLFLHYNIIYKKMEMTIKLIDGNWLNKPQPSAWWNTMHPWKWLAFTDIERGPYCSLNIKLADWKPETLISKRY